MPIGWNEYASDAPVAAAHPKETYVEVFEAKKKESYQEVVSRPGEAQGTCSHRRNLASNAQWKRFFHEVTAHVRSIVATQKRVSSGFTLVELAVVLVILGVLTSIAIPNYIAMNIRAKESKVKDNSHCVQLAVELYATGTGGIYPDATDASIVTNIVPLLPGQQRLRNPFTYVRTEPVVGPAALPGQTGYQVRAPAGVNTGYILTGFGKSNTVITLTVGE